MAISALVQEVAHDEVVSKNSKVFILDDHPLLRHGLAQLINQQEGLEVSQDTASAEEAFSALEFAKPDLMIVDVTLEFTNGLEFIKTAKMLYPEMLFLVHSMHDEALYAERALRAGARGYIMKHEPPDHIVLAIRRILSGQISISESMKERMLEQRYQRVPDNPDPVETLSDRELEVLQFIGRGVTTAHIAELLHRSAKTVETYRGRIKEKLNLRDNTQLIRYAMQWNQEGEKHLPHKQGAALK